MTNKTWNVNDSSKSPKWMFDLFHDCFDPCPLDDNPKIDGLKINWKKRNFVNPPYSDKLPWIKKAIEEQKKGNTSILLLPLDSSAAWYHDLIIPNAIILAFRGRLELDNGKHPRYGSFFALFTPQLTLRGDG